MHENPGVPKAEQSDRVHAIERLDTRLGNQISREAFEHVGTEFNPGANTARRWNICSSEFRLIKSALESGLKQSFARESRRHDNKVGLHVTFKGASQPVGFGHIEALITPSLSRVTENGITQNNY